MDKDYLQGFNEGYMMQKHLPGLARSLRQAKSQSDRMKGFRDGCRGYIVERAVTRAQQLPTSRPKDAQKKRIQSRGNDADD